MNRTVFSADPVLAGLKGFQRATVDHVAERFYGPHPTRRFLVADETGLGKSLVARGVIARAIEHLEHDDTVKRIDVIYVCSNADLVRQNLTRLNVTGDPHLPFASRLTLLAKHAGHLAGDGRFSKPVNLVSFTPGTSFDMGWQIGKAEERAMLFLLLDRLLDLGGHRRRAALNLLRGQVRDHNRFLAVVDPLRHDLADDIDPGVARGFAEAAHREGLLHRFDGLVDEMGRRRDVPESLRATVRTLIGGMRAELARASMHTLEPDLVILDEFQRFRHLLDPSTEAGELAHQLFQYGQTRVLLLSATPYKPFTFAEEGDDDHHRDFLPTLEFLADGTSDVDVGEVAADLAAYRRAAVSGQPAGDLAATLRQRLLRVMCRSERPDGGDGMLTEDLTPAAPLRADDLLGYVALRDVARYLDTPLPIDYWKSAPYFINFCDGYQLAGRLREALHQPDRHAELQPLLHRTERLDRNAIRRYQPVDFGNARLRRLAAETVDAGWWQLPWIPPSLPYLNPGGPYAQPFARDVTKRLVFSSWAATPTAVASLLSYDAERRIATGSRLTENTPAARRAIANRLAYRLNRQRPQSMTTLALFWPMPGLARLGDPLRHARDGGAPVDRTDAERAVAAHLAADLPAGATSRAAGGEIWYWATALRRPDSLPAELTDADDTIVNALYGDPDPDSDTDDPHGLSAHVEHALDIREHHPDLPAPPPDLADTLAALAMHSRPTSPGAP